MNSEQNQDKKNLTGQASDFIIQYINEQHLQPGDRLPNETVFSKSLQIGRGTVREAMKLLESRNIVEIRQGSGTYVSAKKGVADDPLGLIFIDDKESLAKDLMEIRFMIEPSIAAMAAQNASDQEILQIQGICQEIEAQMHAGINHTQKDIEFHTAIAMSSKNVVVPRLIPIINSTIELFIDLTENALIEETLQSHRDITDAISGHDAVGAQDAMYLHLVYNRRRIRNHRIS